MALGAGAEGLVVDDAARGLGGAEGHGAGVGAALDGRHGVVKASQVAGAVAVRSVTEKE